MDNDQLAEALEALPGDHVTEEEIKARIAEVTFTRLTGGTVTICNLTLDNGFSVRGESACVAPENYDQAIGEKLAYDQAFDKLWPLFGFLLAEKRYRA